MATETAHLWKKLFYIQCFFFVCLFAGDDVKTNDSELYFCKVFRYKCFCKNLYFEYCNLFIRKDLLEKYCQKGLKVWSDILNL